MILLVALGLIMLAYYASREDVEPSRQQYDVQAVVDYPVARKVHRAVKRAARVPVDPCDGCTADECIGCPHDPSDEDDDDEDED